MKDIGEWYRGNLHMHSLWSDGDGLPEMIADRFKQAGYNFIAFTEHDRFQTGAPPGLDGRLGATLKRLGRSNAEGIRLRPLAEYRAEVEEPGRFLILNGEEVTVDCSGRRHWINVINHPAPIGPFKAECSSIEAITRISVKADNFHCAAIASLNHPNYRWNATAEKIAAAESLRFFEIHTALDGTHCYGDERRAGAERMWDVALTLRRLKPGAERPLFGIATDDCHMYDTAEEAPCRAWVMVRAPELSSNALMPAMLRGDFYCSTGITLSRLEASETGIRLEISTAPGVRYTTRFIGSSRGVETNSRTVLDENGGPLNTTREYVGKIGEVLQEVHGTKATYRFRGDELYVRALVTSDRLHPCPTIPGDVIKAWTQPVNPRPIRS